MGVRIEERIVPLSFKKGEKDRRETEREYER
jgi:hypothetical protein